MKGENERVHIDDALTAYHDMYPNKKRTVTRPILRQELKKQGFEYDKNLRANGERGVFLGLRLKDDDDEDEMQEFNFEDEKTKKIKEENAYLRKELEDAMNRIKELEAGISNMVSNEKNKDEKEEDRKPIKTHIKAGKLGKVTTLDNPKCYTKTILSFD